MKRLLRRWVRRLPSRLRRPVEALQTMWSLGEFERPRELAEKWSHRDAFARVQRALFYHRWASALLLAHEIDLFSALAEPRPVAELALACGVHERAALALLRILEGQELAARQGDRWSLTPFARLFVARGGRHSLAALLDLCAAQAAAFAELPARMADGRAPAALDIFAPGSRYQAFLDGVNEFLSWAARDLLAQVTLPEVRSFIVGSMGVSTSALVLARQPAAQVTYGCLAHLAAEIPRLRRRWGVDETRVRGTHAHGGDPGADRWGDEDFDLVFLTKKMILRPEEHIGEKFAHKAFSVLRPGGVAILWETVHPEDAPTPPLTAMEAVLDLGASPAGLVNTDGGLRRLLGGIGFSTVDIVPCLNGQTTFVVARRP